MNELQEIALKRVLKMLVDNSELLNGFVQEMGAWAVVQPKTGDPGDPLGQRGKLYYNGKHVAHLYDNGDVHLVDD